MEKSNKIEIMLKKIYLEYHKPKYINPDPLVFVREYNLLADREIAGLIASSLALGQVNLIMNAVQKVLSKFDSIYDDLLKLNYKELEKMFRGFCYRFFKTSHIAGFLAGIAKILKKHGTVGEYFKKLYKEENSLLPAVHNFNKNLIDACPSNPGILVTETWKGSPYKRFNLFLRWMVRCDTIDPGGWDFVKRDELIVPLDTHMMSIGKYLGFTMRKSPSFNAAADITENLKLYDKDDPVRFDFSLTRLGIHPDLTIDTLKYLAK